MPINTDLNIPPYFDDYNEEKDFYRILFQPEVAVQTRELNQLQTILQKQVERFGDNIFVTGTIVDGCNFKWLNPYPYIKINDFLADGVTPAIPSAMNGLSIRSPSTGLQGVIHNYVDGFESQDPDLKTLYIRYINGGNDGNTSAFTAGEALEVFNYNRTVERISISDGGVGFTNSDAVIVTSALVVNTSDTFANGDFLNNGGSANVEIVGVDTVTLSDRGQTILSIKPQDAQLTNSEITSTAWTFANNETVTNDGATATGTIVKIVGSGLEGTIRTDGVGTISNVIITNTGTGYTTPPQVTVKSDNNTTGVAALNLQALNFYANVVCATVTGSVGNGYAFGVSNGVIYQKGHFLRVSPQTVIVSKYSQSPNNIAVGFDTAESIVTFSQDTSLLDPATNRNFSAPGANRLKLYPFLKAVNSSFANTDPQFFTLVEFSQGRPYKQNKTTQYNKINDEMARRTKEESGNYVTDKFIVSSASPANNAEEANFYTLKVDPGAAYVDGYRVRTEDTFSYELARNSETRADNQSISLDYGNYVTLVKMAGLFQFSTGDTIDLYDTATSFTDDVATIEAKTITPSGTKIGEARMRSLVSTGTKDTSGTTRWKLYLFDIRMNAGRNFRDVKGVHYTGGLGGNEGIADVGLTVEATTNTSIAVLERREAKKLLFNSGVQSINNANNINYIYRTIQIDSFSNTGSLTLDISGTPDEFFLTSGNQANSELLKLYVAPIANNLVAVHDLPGTADAATTSNTLTGTSTTWTSELRAGDYVTVFANTTGGGDLHRVTEVVNNTFIRLDSNNAFTNNVSTLRRTFPQNIPIPFGDRVGLSGSVNSNGNILTLSIQYGNSNTFNIDSTTSINTAIAVDIQRTDTDRKTKSPARNRFVQLNLSNNAGGVDGPWCLGVPDVFRLRKVYFGEGATATTSDEVVTNQFYIDHNQNVDYYGLSYLYLVPKNNLNITASDFLLVEFDYFTESGTGGFHDAVSYVSANTTQRLQNDSANLASLGSNTHSFEVPQVTGDTGKHYDLLNQFDFRPRVENTATPNATAGSAPVNPAETISFGATNDPANDKKFPLPGSRMTATVTQYLSRIDSVTINRRGEFGVFSGKPGSNTLNTMPPSLPDNVLKLMDIFVPPYPNAPIDKSLQFKEIINTKVANIRYLYDRFVNRTIERIKSNQTSVQYTQPMGYTMADIGKLEKRIADLEYYVSLSLLESDLKDRVIPSSVDPALNRFKFGFFVDDFSDYERLDTANPRFAAAIEADDLVPPKMSWIAYFDRSNVSSGDYIEEPIIDQLNASEPADAEEPPCLPDTEIANTYLFRTKFNINEIGNTTTQYVDVVNVSFAAGALEVSPGEVEFVNSSATLYFYNYDTDTKIEIYQGQTLLANSGAAVALTANEKVLVVSDEVSNWFDDEYSLYGQDLSLNGDYASYMGKIEFTHNPNLGREYRIVTTKGSNDYRWRWLLRYPIDRSTVGCPPPPQEPPPEEPETPAVIQWPPPRIIIIREPPEDDWGDGDGDGDGGGEP